MLLFVPCLVCTLPAPLPEPIGTCDSHVSGVAKFM